MEEVCNPQHVYEAALLSQAIYKEQPEDDGFILFHHHQGTPEQMRVTNWAIFVTEDNSRLYVVFRGSFTSLDWLVNGAFIPTPHPHHENVEVHSGYFAEINKEFPHVKEQLMALLGNAGERCNSIEKIIITGHSKGGALAQLLTDKFYHDNRLNPMATFSGIVRSKMTCITFSAPMVFLFLHGASHDEVASSKYMTNYIISGDIVPVLHAVVRENRAAFDRMVQTEAASAVPVIGSTLVDTLGLGKQIDSVAPYLMSFQPVGKIYAAVITNLDDLFGVTFDATTFDSSHLGDWACVQRSTFGIAYHTISNHVAIAKQGFKPKVPKFHKRGKGLYVQNTTNEDVLFVMSLLGVVYHWARVPKHQVVYVGSGAVAFDIKVSRYARKKEPTQAAVATQVHFHTLFHSLL